MDNKTKAVVFNAIKGIVKSEIIAFIFFVFASIPINLFVYNEDYVGERDQTPVYIIMMFIYVVANNLVYIRKECQESNVDVHVDKFDIKKDVISYISSDGKILLIIYGVLAVIFELSYLLNVVFMTTLLAFMFPLAEIVKIPVVRTIVSYIITMALLLLVTEYNRYKVYKFWNKQK